MRKRNCLQFIHMAASCISFRNCITPLLKDTIYCFIIPDLLHPRGSEQKSLKYFLAGVFDRLAVTLKELIFLAHSG